MSVRLTKSFIALLLLAVFGTSVWADDSRVGNAVSKLFKTGWTTSIKARAETDELFQAVEQYKLVNEHTLYTYALIKIKQRDFPVATKTLDDLLMLDEGHVKAHKAKIWISMLTRKYSTALPEMERLSNLLPKDNKEPTSQHREIARYLGRMFGFLEGPAMGAVKDDQLSRYEGKIGDQLVGNLEAVFEEGRRSIEQEYDSLAQVTEETADKGKVDAENEQKRLLAELAEKKEDIVDRREKLAPQREKILDEGKSEIQAIAAELKPLVEEFTQLDFQASNIRRELFLINSEIGRYQANFARTKDPIIRSGIAREIDRQSIISSRYQLNLNALKRRAAVNNAKQTEIRRRMAQTQARYAGQINAVNKELGNLSKEEKRNEVDRKKGQRTPNSIGLIRSRSLANKASAFSTYEPFPLEEEKQRLLDMFR